MINNKLCKHQQNSLSVYKTIKNPMDPESWIISQFTKRDDSNIFLYDYSEQDHIPKGYDEEEDDDTIMNTGEEEYGGLDCDSEEEGEEEEEDDLIPVPFGDDEEEENEEVGIHLEDDFSEDELEEVELSEPKRRKLQKTEKRKRPPSHNKGSKKVRKTKETSSVHGSNPPTTTPPPRTKRKLSSKPLESSKRQKTRKALDRQATFNRYRERLLKECTDFQQLHNAYVTDFNLSKVLKEKNNSVVHHAEVLDQLTKQQGYKIKGFLSENKRNGKYVEKVPEGAKRIYIGSANKGTGHEESCFSISKHDLVYS